MPPAAPPTRPAEQPYHFHAYDFKESAAFRPSDAQPGRKFKQFFSLRADLAALHSYGQARGVPNIRWGAVGEQVTGSTDGGPAASTLGLAFGNLGKHPAAPKVLITGGIHANEWIAPEMAYLLAEYLVKNYVGAGNVDRYQEYIRWIVNNREIHILPMLNPAGVNYSVFSDEPGARELRKNRRPLPTGGGWVGVLTRPGPDKRRVPNPPFRGVQPSAVNSIIEYSVPDYPMTGAFPPDPVNYRVRELPNGAFGVDLNRNFPTRAWGYDPPNMLSDKERQWNPAHRAYFGPCALSEPESRNVAAYAANIGSPLAAIDYHSYAKYILVPDEVYYRRGISQEYRNLGYMLESLITGPSEKVEYRFGTAKELLGYSATGTVDAFLAERHAARAFTIELDPEFAATDGFDLLESAIQGVFEKNIRGALALMMAGDGSQQDLYAASAEFAAWKVFGRGNQLPL